MVLYGAQRNAVFREWSIRTFSEILKQNDDGLDNLILMLETHSGVDLL